METLRVIDALNKAVALENAAMLQYKQHALLVRGLWRRVFSEFFSSESHSALDHARKFGQKIVALWRRSNGRGGGDGATITERGRDVAAGSGYGTPGDAGVSGSPYPGPG